MTTKKKPLSGAPLDITPASQAETAASKDEALVNDASKLVNAETKPAKPAEAPEEFGGPQGPEPTRFGDWEHNGRCSDF